MNHLSINFFYKNSKSFDILLRFININDHNTFLKENCPTRHVCPGKEMRRISQIEETYY
jgi:hypothetical protein